ncbi:MAG: type 1 glutamine amidotransferase [Natronomonas sp.]|uniref:type 1 glutamine amidotransferase n=1 Tax=Natronomonas sp. TaxID=2184060 RepID=UPI00286FCB60|nr:type 1 glutamine amidotransferase [Natronomonas sp.]MDR9431785.1 type 1 glutamine amidotransferase [Natronomonas sp.]
MTRIGLTQRVESVAEYDERRDCLDQRWARLMRSMGFTPIPLFNRVSDVEAYVEQLSLDGVVFTGGNDFADLDGGVNVAPERDRFEQSLLTVAIERNLPVLGVCRGLQLVNRYSGGSIRQVDGHVATEHDLDVDQRMAAIVDTPACVTVNSYHNYGVTDESLGEDLTVVARAPDGSIEWIEHEAHAITAIMWHPERDSPAADLDRRIIKRRFDKWSS